jgi:hypothetical protein
VAGDLLRIAATAEPDTSPIRADVLAQCLAAWRGRSFSATGAAVDAHALQHVRPPVDSDAWHSVSDAARREAILAAQRNAVSAIIDSLRPIHVNPRQTLGDLLRDDSAKRRLLAWLMDRPVRRVRFLPDRRVEVRLAIDANDLAGRIEEIFPQSRTNAPALRRAVADALPAAVGTALAPTSEELTTRASTQPLQALLEAPPAWATQQLDAQANSPPVDGKLKTARAAQALAIQKLRAQLDALPLSDGVTLGVAAQRDPRIADLLDRAISAARVYKADYQSDGSVSIKVFIDLRDLWNDLNR